MKPDTDSSRDDALIQAEAANWVARRDAGLSVQDELRMRKWLEADPRHRAAVGYLDAAWNTLAKPARAGAGDRFARQIDALASERFRRRGRMLATLAAVVVFMGLGAFFWTRPAPARAPSESLARVLVPRQQALPDGTIVDLKENARITLDYSPAIRRVALVSGEAHFEVMPDAARPFVVSAGGVNVRAVGTAFVVRRDDAEIEVLVTHGKVSVEKPVAEEQIQPTSVPLASLDAGRMVVVDIAIPGTLPVVSTIETEELNRRLAWRSPRLEFSRTPLTEAIELMNHHAPRGAPRLVVTNPSVGTLRISGIFRADNIEAFVHLLEGTLDVKAVRVDNTFELLPSSAHP
ncbi:MAG: FecR domain-containing protein [Opitutaceae bacterium]|nr:FecR domain-containing protein [Opitutaceae bacterium]